MPNENSQAEPVEVITPEAEVQETATEQVSAQTEPQTEKPITAEDFRKMVREEVLPVIQSQVAKGENRTNQRIQERFSALEANRSVLKLSDEQVQDAQRQIIDEEQRSAFAQPNERQISGSQGQAPSNDLVQMLNGLINAVFKITGTVVTNNDAEFKKIQNAIDKAWTIDGPEGLVMVQIATADASREKAARESAQKKNAAARVAGGGEGSTSDPSNISNITDAKTLYTLGEKKVGGGK